MTYIATIRITKGFLGGVNCQILILEQGFNDYTLAATVV